MSRDEYPYPQIYPVEVGSPAQITGTCQVTIQCYVEIDDPDETFPATATMSYQAYDSSGNLLATPSGPSTVVVGTPVGTNGKKYISNTFTVTVDCTLAKTNPCYLSVSPSDVNDTTTGSPIKFTCQCVPSQPASAPAAGSLPEVEINIRITGGSPHIDCGCGGKSQVKIKHVEGQSTADESLESTQEDSEEEESDDE